MDNNIKEYEAQLQAIEQAIQQTSHPDQKAELEALRSNYLELIDLANATADVRYNDLTINNANIDDEMDRFMAEIQTIENDTALNETTTSTTDIDIKLKELQTDLEKMIGHKCSAPHCHSWGAVAYHNAIVCGIGDSVDINSDGTFEPTLRVLFTNPTHREMLPCTYYLEGDCRYDESRCHFSHGEKVSLASLREYNEPDFTCLARNCIVLAKGTDSLWHRGRVLCANFVEKQCRIRLDGKEHKDREKDYPFEELLPMFHDEDLSSGSSSENSCDSDSETELNDIEIARRAAMVQQSLFTFQPNQALGEWERYTKGIGSKLMERMGYVHGTGLGSEGKGIVIPISAQILPQGRSLDYCMELREAANGDKDLFSVERKLYKEKKKQEAQNRRAYERECGRTDVFSFLNDNIFTNQNNSKNSENINVKNSSINLQEQSSKSLNINSVRISDDIRRKQREIVKTQESIQRNANSAEMQKVLQTQLSLKKQELHNLEKEEKRLTQEQSNRTTKNKLSIF